MKEPPFALERSGLQMVPSNSAVVSDEEFDDLLHKLRTPTGPSDIIMRGEALLRRLQSRRP